MNRKGKVSSIDLVKKTARVYFEELGAVTYEVSYARHINELHVNDIVAVSFFSSDDMKDGIVYAVY